MVDKEIRKVTKDEVEAGDLHDILHDTRSGEQYQISEGYYDRQVDKQTMSESRRQDLQLAKELLNSNLRQLTERQKDVMYYTMLHWPQGKIAEALGITQQAVAEHLEAARRKLAKIITGTKHILEEGLENGKCNTD